MDFFARQDAARRSTVRLTIYFAVAVVLITVATNVFVYFVVNTMSANTSYSSGDMKALSSVPLWIWPTTFTLLVIGGGTLFTFLLLSGGGRSVARMMDARLVDLNTTDPREKRLINVVEEMSIASGTPVPELYIQDGELGINAFVAGYHIREAVLVVTEGCLANLNRSELQGVVGHEFSHILNGDMRINVRLIAVLAGIVLLSQLGGYMLRATRYRRRVRRGKEVFAMAGIGMVLFVLGYIGLFFGRLIKAAISRQREYLADAAAVQFTRNPEGIARALYKIKSHTGGSLLKHAHAENMSHMCFGETVTYNFTRLFATHPELDDRIKAIHPGFIPPTLDLTQHRDTDHDLDAGDTPDAPKPQVSAEGMMQAVITAQVLMDSVGRPTPEHVSYARAIHAGISDAVRASIHEPLGARAVIYALVLAQATDDEYAVARRIVSDEDGEDTASRMADALAEMREMGPNGRLPLVELTFPALGRLHRDQKDQFVKTLDRVIRSDKRFTLFEFALLTLIRRHLIESPDTEPHTEFTDINDVKAPLVMLISLFAKLGTKDDTARKALFTTTIKTFGFAEAPDMAINAQPDALSQNLMQLDRLSPLLKRPVLHACADCIVHDGMIEPAEFELLRATCAALDCPMPPLLLEQGA